MDAKGLNTADRPTILVEDSFRENVRRRKLIDAIFGLLGLFFVVASLAVLVMLFGQLARDGSARLFSGHLVKPEGFAPGVRELVGILQRDGEGSEGWVLQRAPYELAGIETLMSPAEIEKLAGKTVVATGDLPAPGQSIFEATAIEVAEQPNPERFSRDNVHGVLSKRRGEWIVTPAKLPLAFSMDNAPKEELLGRQVAVAPGLSKSLPLKIKSIEPLVFQSFFDSMPSREAERAGIKSALVGSILIMLVTMVLAIPLGVAAGVWLEEYGRKNWFTALLEINIANLAGIPSIVWGLMALGLFVYYLELGRSIQTAGLTLALLVLPIVIMATREAIRAIPIHIREASYACGASKWQTVRYHILPYSLSGILTGSIIGLSRAIGETAPLITIGALTYIAYLPEFQWSSPTGWLRSGFTVLPIQMFNWISRPDVAFHQNAAAAGMILLALTVSMNAVAIVIRYRLRKSIKW